MPALASSRAATSADPLLSVTRRSPPSRSRRTPPGTSGCTLRSLKPARTWPAASVAGRFRMAPARTASSAPRARRVNVSLPPAAASANPSRSSEANHTLASSSGAPTSARRSAIGAMSESVSLTSNAMTRGRGCTPAPLRGSGGPTVLRTRSRRAGGRRPGRCAACAPWRTPGTSGQCLLDEHRAKSSVGSGDQDDIERRHLRAFR